MVRDIMVSPRAPGWGDAQTSYKPLMTTCTSDELAKGTKQPRQPKLFEDSVSEKRIENDNAVKAGVDVVLFSAPHWYVSDTEKAVRLSVLRIGSLTGKCSVTYRTCDESAIAGENYQAQSGQLIFNEGEPLKWFLVPMIPDEYFNTTLSFRAVLESPANCRVDRRMQSTPVYILDDHCFPTNKHEKEIRVGNLEELEKVGVSLLLECMKYTFLHIPTIWWKSVVTLTLDQLSNAYYLANILIRVYLVDVVLNFKDESTSEKLIVPGNRALSAITLAILWFSPNVILLLIDVNCSRYLDMSYTIRKHYRTNLYRKMLNYNDESRREVPIHSMTDALGSTIPDLTANGYLGIFEIVKDLGKVAVVAFYMLIHHPSAAAGLLLFPTAIWLSLRLRQERSLELQEQASDAAEQSQSLVEQSAMAIDIIEAYEHKPEIVAKYEDCLIDQRSVTMEAKMFEFWSDQLVPWLTLIVIGSFMLLGSLQVLAGATTVGTFLATINVYKDLGDRFGGVYRRLNNARNSIVSLLELTHMLNLPTALPEKKDKSNARLDFAQAVLRESPHLRWDALPISFGNVSIWHVPQIQKFNATIDQSSIVLVHGPQGCGKAHMLKAIVDIVEPNEGAILFAPHQSILFLDAQSEMMPWLSLLDNARFGASPELGAPDRVRRIFKRVGIGEQHWIMKHLDRDIAGEPDTNRIPWAKRASLVERKLIHLVRGFVFHPQIMVLHKPMDDVDPGIGDHIMHILDDFVHQGHIEVKSRAKTRTVFLSSGSDAVVKMLKGRYDYEWDLGSTPASTYTHKRQLTASREDAKPKVANGHGNLSLGKVDEMEDGSEAYWEEKSGRPLHRRDDSRICRMCTY